MRIITGRARGMKLLPPKDYAVRPTSDRVKEALFNIIKDRIAGAVVLDAFGGTGNLALEAWSRGARKVVLFDKNRESLRLIRFNVEKAKAGADAIIRHTDAIKGIADAKGNGGSMILFFPTPLMIKDSMRPCTRRSANTASFATAVFWSLNIPSLKIPGSM
mgnify:CR=1 FL=1